MKLENEVCLLEQAETLKVLGVNQNSRYSWCGNKNLTPQENNPERKPWVFVNTTKPANSLEEDHRSMVPSAKPFAAAYNVAELGIMLGSETYTLRTGSESSQFANWAWMDDGNGIGLGEYATEAQARAAMLIHHIEQGYTTVEEVNERFLNA